MMKVETIHSELPLESVDPEEIELLLKRSGLEQRGGRKDLYSRWVTPDTGEGSSYVNSFIVPLNRNMADYTELMSSLISNLDTLALCGNDAIRDMLERLVLPRMDEYRFRKEIPAQGGTIPCNSGEDLFAAAHGVLIAEAKSQQTGEDITVRGSQGFGSSGK